MKIKNNVSLASHTSFKIGGEAKYFLEAENKEDIIEGVRFAQDKNIPFFIIGEGSNILVQDKGFEGLIIKTGNSNIKVQGEKITAESGAKLEDLVKASADNSLTGLEWAAGIPASLGGSIFGNAQAFEESMGDIVEEVEVLDSDTLEIKRIKDCVFSEKNSLFKEKRNLIILSAVLRLKKGEKEEIQALIKEHLDLRKDRHPEQPSAGSVFVNQPGEDPCSRLIEKAGLKGKRIGDAQVSEKHAGFIINLGKATSKDVLELISLIKKQVKEKFNIDIKEEIQII